MTKTEFDAQTPEQRDMINQNVNLADIADMAMIALDCIDDDVATAENMLISICNMLYPNRSYTATAEEQAKMAKTRNIDKNKQNIPGLIAHLATALLADYLTIKPSMARGLEITTDMLDEMVSLYLTKGIILNDTPIYYQDSNIQAENA